MEEPTHVYVVTIDGDSDGIYVFRSHSAAETTKRVFEADGKDCSLSEEPILGDDYAEQVRVTLGLDADFVNSFVRQCPDCGRESYDPESGLHRWWRPCPSEDCPSHEDDDTWAARENGVA